jgi:hypothetical protein
MNPQMTIIHLLYNRFVKACSRRMANFEPDANALSLGDYGLLGRKMADVVFYAEGLCMENEIKGLGSLFTEWDKGARVCWLS